MITAYHRVIALRGAPCLPDAGACSNVFASFERDAFSTSMDSGRTFREIGNVSRGDTTTVGLAADGTWSEVADGTSGAAGYSVEALMSLVHLRLPGASVRVGESWPIESSFARMTQPFGQIRSFFRGRATLDSVVGTRAWITVHGVDSSDSREGAMLDSTHSTLSWDLENGGLLESTTVSTIRALNARAAMVMRSHRRSKRLPVPPSAKPAS